MASKPAYKRILGRRIVSIEQSWWPAEPCRGQGVWGVDAIVLDDGARIVLETLEREDFYTVRMIRVPKEVMAKEIATRFVTGRKIPKRLEWR